MTLIKQLFFTFLFLVFSTFAQAEPVCDPDPNVKKLLREMVNNAGLAEVIKDNGEFAQYWRTMGTEDLIKAWSVLESDETLRKDPKNIVRIRAYIEFAINRDSSISNKGQAIKNLTKSFNSQTTEEDRKKWTSLKHTKSELETHYASMSQNPPPKLIPWTKEHKAQRWNNYKAGNGNLSYAAWSNVYDGNINKTKKADEAAKDYAASLPGAKREITSDNSYTIQLTHNGRNQEVTGKRRHDIIVGQNAYEVKDYRSSKVNLSTDIEREVLMDVAMMQGPNPAIKKVTWVFTRYPDGGGVPSGPLKDLLNKHGINIEYRNP